MVRTGTSDAGAKRNLFPHDISVNLNSTCLGFVRPIWEVLMLPGGRLTDTLEWKDLLSITSTIDVETVTVTKEKALLEKNT